MKQNSFSTCCCRFQSGLLHCEKINTKVGANNEESRNLQEQEWKLCILNQSRYKSECTHGRVHRKSIWGISPQNWKSQGLIPIKILISSLAFKLVRPNPTHFFGLNPILDQKFGSSQVGPQGRKKGSIRLGWCEIGFNLIMYLI